MDFLIKALEYLFWENVWLTFGLIALFSAVWDCIYQLGRFDADVEVGVQQFRLR